MKVKIIQSMIELNLERNVNEFLKNKRIEVIELQYSATSTFFSVMIVYKDKR